MKPLSAAEQVAAHLREDLLQGRWQAVMPGRDRLARELGVHGSTVERALGQLEQEGLLNSQGAGKRRRITLKKKKCQPGSQIVVVLYERGDESDYYLTALQHQLLLAGHKMTFAPKTLMELKHDPERVEEMVRTHPGETCIIVAGSKPVMERLSKASTPTFGLFGNIQDLPIAGAGPTKIPAIREAVRSLHEQGHQRIVMLARAEQMTPKLGGTVSAFLEELEKWNLPHGSYNLPKWDNTPDGLRGCLVTLFQITPPTAILIDDWKLMFAVQNYLLHQRGSSFNEVKLVCTDQHETFTWSRPHVAHFHWDPLAVVRYAVNWANNVALGKDDRSQKFVVAKFKDSGTSWRQ